MFSESFIRIIVKFMFSELFIKWMTTFLPASFELMRKEQHKAFQDKHKLNSDKNNDDFDISSLVEDDEKRLVSRSNESVELHVTLASLSNDEKSSSLSQTPSAARPLVPLALQVQNWNEILQPKHP